MPLSASTNARRAAIGSAFGSALEWLDFTAYGAISATVLPKLFFPTLDPANAMLASFATFGVGFLARPAGGLIFGLLGDRLGRKNVLFITLLLMGTSSLLIGLMPPYSAIGVWAPGAIVLLRFLQGFALGGESTGAQLFTMEHAPSNRRGLYGSFINIAAPASQVLANALLLLMAKILTDQQFMDFGWRVPFLLSILLIAVGLYMRARVPETPAFEHLLQQRSDDSLAVQKPARPSIRKQFGTISRLMLFWAGPASCYYIVTVFSLAFLKTHTEVSSANAFLCLMAANAVAVAATVAGGMASDRFGRKPPLIMTSMLMLITSLGYFALLASGSLLLIFIAMASFAGAIQAQSGILPAFFAEQFPTSSRYTGSALAYSGANLLFAGPTPFVATWVMQRAGGSTIPLTILSTGLLAMSFVALLVSPETRDVDIDATELPAE